MINTYFYYFEFVLVDASNVTNYFELLNSESLVVVNSNCWIYYTWAAQANNFTLSPLYNDTVFSRFLMLFHLRFICLHYMLSILLIQKSDLILAVFCIISTVYVTIFAFCTCISIFTFLISVTARALFGLRGYWWCIFIWLLV